MISNLKKLKQKMIDKSYLYEEEEHAVLKLAEDAVAFITSIANDAPRMTEQAWLEEHK